MAPRFTVSVTNVPELPLQKGVPGANGLPKAGPSGSWAELYDWPMSVQVTPSSVEISRTAADFREGSEPGRLRTWFETRIDRIEIVQASANGVNIAVTYSRRDRSGRIMSSYEAVLLVVRRDDGWRVQAISTI